MSGRASKQKGNGFEREVVALFERYGFTAKRAWGSNGQSIGESEEVDVVAQLPQKITVQCKRRRALPKVLKAPDGVTLQAVREDFGATYFIVEATALLSILRSSQCPSTQNPSQQETSTKAI